MIQGKTVLAIIPARGGSKGIPRKNIVSLAGKPLLAWSIEAAKKSKYIDRLILSSEDEEIINIASAWGCDIPFLRPIELARDETPMIEPILHALDTLKDDFFYIVLLQPTSPLRSFTDIDGCIELCHRNQAPACVSITETGKSPYWMYQIDEAGHLLPLLKSRTQFSRRQDVPRCLVNNH
jgi:CMP-N,N'-diacetyllegionaminic acid synthase